MRDFSRPRGRLRPLPLLARVVYSIFLAFTLCGLAMTAWLTQDMIGLDLSGLDQYYAGAAAAEEAGGAPGTSGGPALELPDDLGLAGEAMPLRKLLEVTHFHLFSMPIYLMVLSHLFMLSRLGDPTKLGCIALASVATAVHMAAPWLARGGGGSSSLVYGSSGAAMALTFLAMSAVPLWEMWAPAPRS